MSDINLGGWERVRLVQDNVIGELEEWHMIPINDYRPHVFGKCWCKPVEHEPDTWVHNSLDQREKYEEGRKLQ